MKFTYQPRWLERSIRTALFEGGQWPFYIFVFGYGCQIRDRILNGCIYFEMYVWRGPFFSRKLHQLKPGEKSKPILSLCLWKRYPVLEPND